MSSSAKGLAGRYAGALYALAEEAGKVDAVVADMTGLAGLVSGNHALTRIINACLAEHARRRGQVSAEGISAIELDDARRARVEAAVAKLAGSDKLSLSMHVDPSLIGGLVVRIGSRMIDTSVKTKLNRLETAMKGIA